MRIALFHPWVYLKSGLERSLLELTGRSRHEWVIFTSHLGDNTFPEMAERQIVELDRVPVRRGYGDVMQAAMTIIRQKIDLQPFDLLVVSSEGLGDFFVFRNHGRPIVCFCHTPLKVIHDPYSRARYLRQNPRARVQFIFFSWVFGIADRLAWRRYEHVICNSHETRGRVLRAGLAPASKIEVIHPGLDTKRMKPSGEYGDFFLLPGRIMWQKNIELGIEAFRHYQEQGGKLDLVIAGTVDEKSRPYLAHLRGLAGASSGIRFLEGPADEELFALYRTTYTVLFTSLNEDWGMVPLEAMGFGKPVIAVNRGGPTESIVNGETGYLVEPVPETFADRMRLLSDDSDLVRRIGQTARGHVLQYDWSGFVEKFDNALERVVGRASKGSSTDSTA